MTFFISSQLDVKAWCADFPTVHAVRPPRCLGCGIASQQPGRNLMLHGHGCRERQQRGPAQPDAPPEVTGVWLRRYQCQACNAVCAVGPADIAPRYLYSAPAIAWAIALFGLAKMSVAQVRRSVAVWRRVGATAYGRWSTLMRWLRDVQETRLFPGTPHVTACFGLRRFAEALAACIAAQAPPAYETMPMTERTFFAARSINKVATM